MMRDFAAIALLQWCIIVVGLIGSAGADTLQSSSRRSEDNISRNVQALSSAIRINAGASEGFTDEDGNEWEADRYYTGGQIYGGPAIPHYYAFQGPEYYANWSRLRFEAVERCRQSIYCYERFGSFEYSIPVEPGPYTVTLYFTENAAHVAGDRRRFDVYLEGKLVKQDLSVSGGVVLSYQIPVLDGDVTISFGYRSDNPKINAIEVIPYTGSTPQPTPMPTASPTLTPPVEVNINSGAWHTYVDSDGLVWNSDFGRSIFAPTNPVLNME